MKHSEEIMRDLDQSMHRLHQIWNRLGIGEQQKSQRNATVIQHLQHLLDEMVEEEETLENQILDRIKEYTAELSQLTKDLDLPELKNPSPTMPVLQHEKWVRGEVETLRKEKGERMKILKKLRNEDQQLCDVMCMTPYYIPSGTTPSGEQLEKLQKHINSLTAEKERRFQNFLRQKKQIADLMLEMERSADTDFERDVMNESESDFLLSSDNMQALDALHSELVSSKVQLEKTIDELWARARVLWERLETPQEETDAFCQGKEGYKSSVLVSLQSEISRCEALKLQHIQRFVTGTREELHQWWDRCFYSAEQRQRFKYFDNDDFSEELLQKHEAEVASVKEYYENHQCILEKVAKREQLFSEMIEFDRKATDPSRFFQDRGGRLLLEEKARKKLLKELPKVETSVKEQIQEWERAHGRQFLVNGMPFLQYVEYTWQEFNNNKAKEKEERQKAKTKLMEAEMHYGSKPSTPVKRRLGTTTTTPSKTPKFRKVNEQRTPASTSRIQHSTMFASPCGRAPVSCSKVPQASKVMSSASKMTPGSRQRRRSNRLARKVLGDCTTGTNETVFSHTTVAGCGSKGVSSGGNVSIASTGSYQDFAGSMSSSLHSTHILAGPADLYRAGLSSL